MHMDNLYILMCDRDGITEDDMRKLEQVDCKIKWCSLQSPTRTLILRSSCRNMPTRTMWAIIWGKCHHGQNRL